MKQASLLIESPDTGAASGDRSQLAAALLALQGAMYIVTAIEAAGISAVTGNAAGWGPVVMSLLLASALLRSRRRVRLHRSLRRVRVLEWLLLGWAGIDLALAVFLNDTGLGLLPTLTRFGIPVAIIVLLYQRLGR